MEQTVKCRLVAFILGAAAMACSPRPEANLTGRWEVQQVAGASLGENVHAWIEFDASGNRVRGFTGCNAFTSTVSSFDTTLTFAPAAEESAACPSEAAAVDEARLLAVLPSVQRYIRHGRSLELLTSVRGSEALIKLRLSDEMAR